jgi:hypothetical protein
MSPDTAELAGPEVSGETAIDSRPRRHDADAVAHVRASDIEPYIGLRYLSKLFRFMAIILVLLLVAEVITGIMKQGRASIPTLLGEMSRLIDVGHDVRAARILLSRQVAHNVLEHPEAPLPQRDPNPHRRSSEIATR